MQNFHFGQNLRIIRLVRGISQDAMAPLLGISQTTYCRMESNPKACSPEMLEKLSKVFDVAPSVLLGGVDPLDLMPKNTLEKKAKDFIRTWVGGVFYWILVIPFVDAAYWMGNGFCEGYGTTEDTRIVVRFITGAVAFIFTFYLFYRIRKGKD